MKNRRSLAGRTVVGLAGGLAGAFAMNMFARAMQQWGGGREADGAAPGADRRGRGVQPAQADGPAALDATVQVGRAGYRAVTGEEPGRDLQPWLGSAAHYTFGAMAGAGYVLASEALPMVRSGYGALYGLLVWAIADEGMIPALALSRGPSQLTADVHAFAVAGHLVWAATLDGMCRAADA